MQRTALYDEHVKIKAKMVPFAGFDMPIQYQGVKEEVLATRNKVGIFDVSHMGEFWVEGEQCYEFLDHLVTNDINNAALGKAVYSPLCREDGTVIDDLIVYKLEEKKALVCVNASNIDKDWKWFTEQAKNFAVSLENKSDQTSLVAIQGPDSEKFLKSIDLSEAAKLPYYSCANVTKQNVIVARTGYTGEDGFEIFGPHEVIKNMWSKAIEHGVQPCGLAARDVLRLEVCYPLYGHELNDDVTPLDSSLKWTLKKDERDFLGKSVLKDYSPKYKLVKLSIEKGIPRQSYKVLSSSDEVIGEITSGTYSPTLGRGIALAHVDQSKYSKGEKLKIEIRNNKVPATIHTKPFVNGGHK